MEKMRLVVLVNLTGETRHDRKVKREFEEHLFKGGFSLLQEGVFTRVADGRTNADLLVRRLKEFRPDTGIVRLITMTERQFKNSLLLSGVEDSQESEIGSQPDIFL